MLADDPVVVAWHLIQGEVLAVDGRVENPHRVVHVLDWRTPNESVYSMELLIELVTNLDLFRCQRS